ncbi:hypothetical protein KP509_10G021200 [Ceratopteris richardii]|nr:hypothetical protein KP509_10G021200 [Ceratopteris richardii]
MLFSDATRGAVQELLPEYAGGSLASLCSWADEVRFKYRWSSALHYIDTPDFRCNYNYDRDCHDSDDVKDRCAAGAIKNYTSQLASSSSSSAQYNLTEALLFLAHFVGDIHQPLHVGFTSDLGGNSINVHCALVDDIGQNITQGYWNNEIAEWESCPGIDLACPDMIERVRSD